MRKLFCLFTEVCYNIIAYAEEDAYGILHAQPERNGGLFGGALAPPLSPGSVVAYFGGLGMGKTAFTRGLAAGLGYQGRVTSPTFTIVNEYEGGRLPLFHFDMYRLTSAEDLFDIGWEDYLSRGGVCAVEWSENIADALPADAIQVRIERVDDMTRRITVEGVELP